MKTLNQILVSLILLQACTVDKNEKIETGKFEPNWESLKQYESPDWFRDAKFGIWAHWGPQCQPGQGDWYARGMYSQGHRQYNWHVEHMGHPSEFGFKDIIHQWKAEKWSPDSLVSFYKQAGAKYFFAMANHHDNMDLWDSKYQPWNSVNMGPKKDIMVGWARAARENGLPLGISVHAAHAWLWYETAQQADTEGEYAGIPYDGKLTKEDGKGTWWEGYDPQDLYAQNHPLSTGSENLSTIHSQWGWENGATPPSEAYCNNFLNRTVDLINQFNPDLLYFDDTALPLWPVSDVGLKIAAHYYNHNMKQNNGKLDAVLFGKILTEEQKECMLWDVEKGAPDQIQDQPWQTCTCIGGWHYEDWRGESGRYKPANEVIRMLADVVSKNGNLLLNIPVKGDGSIDKYEIAIVEEIGAWLKTNGEAIYGTRPWKVFGEGPVTEKGNPIKAQGFNEGMIRELTSRDIRFTQKGDVLYAIVMEWPENNVVMVKSLAGSNDFKTVEVIGSNAESFSFDENGLLVQLPETAKSNMPVVIKIY